MEHRCIYHTTADSTVRVRSGDIIEVPLTLTPNQVNVGFEFEVEFNTNELEFVDMKTGNLRLGLLM